MTAKMLNEEKLNFPLQYLDKYFCYERKQRNKP